MTAFCDTETTRLTMLVLSSKRYATFIRTREGVTQSDVRPNPPRYARHRTMRQDAPGYLDVRTAFRAPSRPGGTSTFELLKPYLRTEQSVMPIDYDRGEF